MIAWPRLFPQLTHRESLRAIEACLGSRPARACLMGFQGRVTRTELAYANEQRDWRVFAGVAAVLMRRARRLYAETPFELGLEADLFALDATLIELSLALCPWARWQQEQASVQLNVLLDSRDNIPVFASLYEGNRHEVASLDEIPVYPGAYYALDGGYVYLLRLHRLHAAGACFVTRLKAGIRYYVAESSTVDETVGLRCDQTIRLNSRAGRREYPETLRRISYVDSANSQALVILTNPVRTGGGAVRPDLPPTVANRNHLEVAQAAPAVAGILQHFAQWNLRANLVSVMFLPARGDCQAPKAPDGVAV